jgi:hypothetical protein
VAVEQQRGVFHEHGVRILGQVGKADDLQSRLRESRFVSRMLTSRLRGIDRRALEMRQLAFRNPRAYRPGESAGHQ